MRLSQNAFHGLGKKSFSVVKRHANRDEGFSIHATIPGESFEGLMPRVPFRGRHRRFSRGNPGGVGMMKHGARQCHPTICRLFYEALNFKPKIDNIQFIPPDFANRAVIATPRERRKSSSESCGTLSSDNLFISPRLRSWYHPPVPNTASTTPSRRIES